MWPWMEPPFDKDIRFVQGDDFSLPVNLNTPTSGFAFNAYLTPPSGAVIPFTVKTPGPLGTIAELFLGGAITGTILPGVYPWQFSFTNYLGQRITWYQGNATVIANN